MTHIWQWNGNGQAPGGLIEGIADFVRLKANYAPSHWVQPGQGDRWDQDYDVTARFLDNCNSLRNGPPLSPTPTSSTSTAANHLSPPVGGLQSLAGLRFRTLVSKIIVLTIISNVDLSSILFIAHHSLDEEDYKSLRKAIHSIQIQSKTETESSSLFRNSPDRLHHI
ncbi:hypothetical protein VitviT2T_003587 [Vitis vinifera]|uniref:Uncharacterized protein n=1 Tax=Vitis vinifera TaxID=29760 RepID=A0ABY9BMV9_VITVI|nr:hypothetical protein VitviT2T_003587 [Vitis vinifera]